MQAQIHIVLTSASNGTVRFAPWPICPPGIKPQETEWAGELVWMIWRREISAASTKNQNTISVSPGP